MTRDGRWPLLVCGRFAYCGAAAYVLSALVFVACSRGDEGGQAMKIMRLDDRVRIEWKGDLLTEYRFENVDRPFFYPVIGPTGVNVTRHWPMKEVENEERDHTHHRGLWYVHGDVNGHDFWTEGRGTRVRLRTLDEIGLDGETAVIRCSHEWVAKSGEVVCTDRRVHRIRVEGDARLIDFEITFYASHGELVLGDTKEGTMAIRVPPTLRVQGAVGKGHIVNSEGARDGGTWGKRAAWCDYYGPLEGETVGIAMFDHPGNPRHPTWWHVRTYGLFAANPFGILSFERGKAGSGELRIPAGESRTWRYRVYIHRGDEKEGKVADAYRAFAVP